MKKLLILLLIITVFVSGCIGQTEKQEETTSTISTTTMPKIATKEVSQMALQLLDMSSSNYTIKERAERVRADVSPDALDLGWKRGYYVSFARIGESIFDITAIEHLISIYPIENISKVLTTIPRESTENITFNELSRLDIGDDSRAYRIDAKNEFGTEYRYYQIEFVKMDVYMSLYMTGTSTDYELLKDLAKKAESRIS